MTTWPSTILVAHDFTKRADSSLLQRVPKRHPNCPPSTRPRPRDRLQSGAPERIMANRTA